MADWHPIYSTGTASVGNGSTSVTGQGTNWNTAGLRAGDQFKAAGLSISIATVNSPTSITLAQSWPGATRTTDTYEVLRVSDADRLIAAHADLMAALVPNLTAFGGLEGGANKLPYFSGANALSLANLTPYARTLLDDADAAAALATLGAATPLRATIGGSANAITLTDVGALVAGRAVRFRATSPNSGAATIAYNGGSPIACRTITGVALPAGYIRTDADTVAIYDGTYWVLDRQEERGSNANGEYVRFADGMMICRRSMFSTGIATNIASGAIYRGTELIITFPAVFSSQPSVAVGWSASRMSSMGTPNTTGVYGITPFSSHSSDTTLNASFLAIGRWF